jgi:predicted nucleic acid-binding protein
MKIFLDANIIVDLLDKPSFDHDLAKEVVRIIRLSKKPVYISPTTFAITWYLFSKRNKGNKNVRNILINFFKYFSFTTEDEEVMRKVLASNFSDLEDALQYYSAKQLGLQLIITKNKKDFIQSNEITVIHPAEFIELHYNN